MGTLSSFLALYYLLGFLALGILRSFLALYYLSGSLALSLLLNSLAPCCPLSAPALCLIPSSLALNILRLGTKVWSLFGHFGLFFGYVLPVLSSLLALLGIQACDLTGAFILISLARYLGSWSY